MADLGTREARVVDRYRLTPLQEGMLFHSLCEPDSGVYIEQMIIRLRGAVDCPTLAAAWQWLIDRHAALRTRLAWQGQDAPHQEVLEAVPLLLVSEDWRHLTAIEQATQLEAFLEADRRRGFDLTVAPLLRVHLVQVAPAESVMIWTFHHVLLDGRSYPILLRELFDRYQAQLNGESYQPPSLRAFADFVAWLGASSPEASERFWRETLHGLQAPTPLPIAAPATPPSGSHTRRSRRLSAATTAHLVALAEAAQVTLNTVIQTAWAILLGRYSGEPEVVFGVTRAGRRSSIPGAETMVGLLINTLPLRIPLPEMASVIELLQLVRARHTAIGPHEHTPLVKVQEWSPVARTGPLFESILVFENHALEEALAGNGQAWPEFSIELREQTNYPLLLSAYGGKELLLNVDADQRRFDETAIDRLLGHLQTILEACAEDPTQIVGALPLLTKAEAHQLLIAWNATRVDGPGDRCIHDLIAEQAAAHPAAPAVVGGDTTLTYGDLDRRASQLAQRLRRLGVGPEVIVGLCFERSPALLISILAVLKAGGAYLPLDPDYPTARLAFMLDDARVTILLTEASLLNRLPELPAEIICLDRDWPVIATEAIGPLESGVTADHLAYVIYTSGSTGLPKGVMISHRNLVSSTLARTSVYQERVRSFLLLSSYAFDSSVAGIFWTLCQGGCLVLPPEIAQTDLDHLVDLIERNAISHLLCLPTLYELILERALPEQLACLQVAIVAGESCSVDLVQQHHRCCPHAIMANEYGPTEATVWSSVHLCQAHETGPVVPIGRAIDNTYLYLLDHQRRPLPIGIPGELYIGGAGVARGYLNRPELTSERFVTNPLPECPGTRLYRTGDRVRQRADGSFEFLGRLDDQFKLRGIRIEPGEIEAHLTHHPRLRTAAVSVRELQPGERRLVAHIVVDGPPPTSTELRAYLRHRLPEHLIPTLFVALPSLPQMPNGKLDRQALPLPKVVGLERDRPYLPPRNDFERRLVQVWTATLGVSRISIEDDIFELGAHSLLILRMSSQIAAAGLSVTPRDIFLNPTIARLAAVIAQRTRTKEELIGDPILPVARDGYRI